MLKEILLVFSFEFIAFALGLAVFKYLNKSFKLIWLQVMLALVVEIVSYVLGRNGINNLWLNNCFLIVDCALLTIAAYYFIQKKAFRIYLLTGYAIFLLVWLVVVSLHGILNLANLAFVVAFVLQLAAYMYILYHKTIEHKQTWYIQPTLWLCLGLIMFYGCGIPFFSFFNYLTKKDWAMFLFLLNIIKILSSICYLLTALSFYLIYKNYQKSILPA